MFAYEIAENIRQGKGSVLDVVTKALTRAKAVQEKHNAFITICEAEALARAKALDERLARGEVLGPLGGVPVVVKDNICTKGVRTTAASRILENFVPPYSATVVERLEHAGAILIAKSNLDEFGMGSSNENSAFGPTSNAWDESRIAGGSSGGSAVAVATGVVPLALGTDTGGSVRQPAALNGILGFKPTYGRLSRYGVIAYASSLDQVGILARNAKDIALAMNAMGGQDLHDATSLVDEPKFVEAVSKTGDLKGWKIGLIRELCSEGNSQGVQDALQQMCQKLEDLGAEIREISLPHVPYAIASYYIVAPAEASSNLARYDGILYGHREGENSLGQAKSMMKSRGVGFGPEVRRRILIGSYALSAGYYDAYYGKALKVRRLIANDFKEAFKEIDVLLSPTAPHSAFKIGEKSADPLAMYLEDIDTVAANLVGIGGISIPAGFSEGMPCGVQFLAPVMADERLLELAAILNQEIEVAQPWLS
ncbi:MAG: Asp-tRNA(Asn)/Glu-tRNA(Gln) amidotransferase subunit GatA [Deinococcales bacterium]